MNKIGALVGIAVAVVAAWFFLLRAKDPTSIAAEPVGSGSATASGSASAAATTRATPVDKVGRVSPEERKRLADQIAKARANRQTVGGTAAGTATTGTPPPQLPDNGDTKLVRTTMREAMREILPYLAECYDKADKLPAEIKVVANMTLTGDPDIGTIIDTDGVADGDGKPLDAAFDLCLKDAFVSLQMPPLSEGSEVKVTYPFVFARNDPDEAAGSGTLPP